MEKITKEMVDKALCFETPERPWENFMVFQSADGTWHQIFWGDEIVGREIDRAQFDPSKYKHASVSREARRQWIHNYLACRNAMMMGRRRSET